MAITDYTTYAEVRAALGLNSDELTDDTLSLQLYSSQLDAEIDQISTTLAADYATIKAKVISARTSAEKKVYDGVALFAPFAVAKALAPSLPLLAPKTITDGKASVTRDSASPYKAALENAEAMYETARQYLIDAYAGFTSVSVTTTLRPFLGISSPSVDPVTG